MCAVAADGRDLGAHDGLDGFLVNCASACWGEVVWEEGDTDEVRLRGRCEFVLGHIREVDEGGIIWGFEGASGVEVTDRLRADRPRM